MPSERFGARPSAARKNAGAGLRMLARRINVSPVLIYLIENGRSAPVRMKRRPGRID